MSNSYNQTSSTQSNPLMIEFMHHLIAKCNQFPIVQVVTLWSSVYGFVHSVFILKLTARGKLQLSHNSSLLHGIKVFKSSNEPFSLFFPSQGFSSHGRRRCWKYPKISSSPTTSSSANLISIDVLAQLSLKLTSSNYPLWHARWHFCLPRTYHCI